MTGRPESPEPYCRATRTPAFMADLDVHSLSVLDARSLPTETAWGKVPTPSF